MYIVYLRTRFQRPSSDNSLLTAIKTKAKGEFRTETITQKCCTSKSCVFDRDPLPYNVPGPQQYMKLWSRIVCTVDSERR